jgi:hypothetical protein
MGAQQFHTLTWGKDVNTAFNHAVETANWHYGHDGYTGTIAEKNEYRLFSIPPRICPNKIRKALEQWPLDYELDGLSNRSQIGKKNRVLEQVGLSQTPRLRYLIDSMIDTYDNKWGAAVAMRIKQGKLDRELRNKYGRKGQKGSFYLFCGWASS